MPWLDSLSYIDRYAYFGVFVGYLLESSTELSDIGVTFMNYTGSA